MHTHGNLPSSSQLLSATGQTVCMHVLVGVHEALK